MRTCNLATNQGKEITQCWTTEVNNILLQSIQLQARSSTPGVMAAAGWY